MSQLSIRELTVSSTNTSNSKKHKKNSRLAKLVELQQRIVRLEERNQKKSHKINAFYDEAKEIIGPVEEALCEQLEGYIEKLLSFLPRKTIKGQKREELVSWIKDEIHALEHNPFRKKSAKPLRDKMSDYLYQELEEAKANGCYDEPDSDEVEDFREMLESMFQMSVEHDDETLLDVMRNPEKVDEFMEALLKQKLSQEDNEDNEENDLDEETFFSESQKQSENMFKGELEVNGALKTSQLNKLYKKLAVVLHPDKEESQDKKDEKHQLMQQLSKAKKEKDIYTLLQLAQQWLPDMELELSKESLNDMIESLNEKVSQLEDEYHRLDEPSSIETMVWYRFGEKTKKASTANLHQHVDDLSERIEQINVECTRFKTVKEMNKVLGERLRPRWSPNDVDTDMLERILGL
ncbi:J domain-containing protein [Parashewanella spongiae]|uniref:J domain-containing protein n=1 Tax=Parashewanella spongiae TaxID=342950 RepID=A0A3A6TIU4_9GAMM|nr:J domain-containing protein [Parashewanella spongiae]MCL1079693.1 J domain-containing protein [Parashewanella spongiae]RJY07040.1 J domain-containing protein [Parashewanella spongiae]